jgi:hypothetical protein
MSFFKVLSQYKTSTLYTEGYYCYSRSHHNLKDNRKIKNTYNDWFSMIYAVYTMLKKIQCLKMKEGMGRQAD